VQRALLGLVGPRADLLSKELNQLSTHRELGIREVWPTSSCRQKSVRGPGALRGQPYPAPNRQEWAHQ
jgi:hypothetical protein